MKRIKTITKYFCDNCEREIRDTTQVWHIRGKMGGPTDGGELIAFDLCDRCCRGRRLPVNKLNGSGSE